MMDGVGRRGDRPGRIDFEGDRVVEVEVMEVMGACALDGGVDDLGVEGYATGPGERPLWLMTTGR